jgi:hypothetical protein
MNKGDLVAEVAKVVKSKRVAEDAVSLLQQCKSQKKTI